MEIETSILPSGQVKVVLRGRMDTIGVDRIETRFVGAIAPRGQSAIVDLSEVTFVNSMGLRVFISVARTLARKQAKLALFAPQDAVREVFDSVQLNNIIAVRETEAEALESLSA